MYSKGEKLHFIILSIVNEDGGKVLRRVLIKQLAGSTIDERLAEAEIKAQVNDALSRAVIGKDQYESLYPPSGTVKINNLDVTLLVFLIRQLHPSMKVSNKIWTNPSHGDLSPEADVTRLKIKRNKSVHSGKTSLSFDEFEIEFQELEMILCRLVRYVNTEELTVPDIVQTLEKKKHGLFENKPSSSHVATSTSSSLEMVPVCVDDTESCFSQSSTESAEYSNPVVSFRKEATTSTSSLEKKRKLSFKVKSCIEPFIMSPKKITQKENTPVPKRIKTKEKQKLTRRKCKTCSCSLQGSCSNEEANSILTNDHSSQDYRCNISGISMLGCGVLIVADSSHDTVQALSTSGEIIDEFECSKPHGVVALGLDNFAVTLRTISKVVVLKFNTAVNCIELENEFEVLCDSWLNDIKCSGGYLYILCENGDLHILDRKTGSDAGTIFTNIQFSSNFDITEKGDRLFLTHGQNVTCLDGFGNTVWSYMDKTRKTFKSIAVHKEIVYVCAWDRHKVISLTSKEGKSLKEFSDEHLRSPWSILIHRKRLYVSQYMSALNSSSCREIVVMKI